MHSSIFRYKLLCLLILFLLNSCNSNSERKRESTKSDFPKALVSGIRIQHIMKLEPNAVRMAQNPVTGEFWYINFTGDVFKIDNINTKTPFSIKEFTVRNHGIEKLQGMAFCRNTLYLCGNSTTRDGKGNIGRMVRYELAQVNNPIMSVVFNTVEYGTNKTTFDHGWNAIVISPNQRNILVNSGSRTDHGEIQDNEGAWPGARNGSLTAKIFQFPINAKNILLKDDEKWLKSHGYIFAEGLRNAFALGFHRNNELYAAVNSGDYDHPEDMFWVRQNHHYGFPWIMGATRNPQQDSKWKDDPKIDPFLSENSFAFNMGYFHADSKFPQRSTGLIISSAIENIGPDANEYRDPLTGKINDADTTNYRMQTFTPHSSPVGLAFDVSRRLPKPFKGDGFLLRYSSTDMPGSLLAAFTNQGEDLLHLHLIYDRAINNYKVSTRRIISGFKGPVDAVISGKSIYVLENSLSDDGNLWRADFQ
jgi:glucose/arabinose dehydrogenase